MVAFFESSGDSSRINPALPSDSSLSGERPWHFSLKKGKWNEIKHEGITVATDFLVLEGQRGAAAMEARREIIRMIQW